MHNVTHCRKLPHCSSIADWLRERRGSQEGRDRGKREGKRKKKKRREGSGETKRKKKRILKSKVQKSTMGLVTKKRYRE